MTRSLILALAIVANIHGATASDELPLHAIRNAAPVAPSSDFWISGASLTPMVLAEWETTNRDGKTVQIVWGQEAVEKAPATASKYEQKSYVFPTGTIRVLDFKKAKGGMVHMITVETGLFMLKGAGTVGVGGRDVEIATGDAVYYPSGVLKGSDDATVILWTTTGTKNNGAARAAVKRAADAVVSQSAEWQQDGQRVRATTPQQLAAAPANAVRLTVNRYEFDGNSVRVALGQKGGPTTPSTAPLDALIYITSGKYQFFQQGRMVEVGPGDAIREIAGEQHYWIRLEDSSFVATSSLPITPLAPEKLRSGKAVH